MRITLLELYRYKLVSLNNIEKIVYTPESKVQLILGTNGSGKSSLMKELSPLPADRNEYDSGGYKLIHITHKGSEYVLRSEFGSKATYSFIKDGEELNEALGITYYNELVYQYFRLDKKIHALITGKEKFHSMSVAERRSWLTRLSNEDYTFAINFYNSLNKELRDIEGGIRLTNSRIISLSDGLIPEDKVSEEREQIKEITELIDQFSKERWSLKELDLESLKSKKQVLNNHIERHLAQMQIKVADFETSLKDPSIDSFDYFITKETELETKIKMVQEHSQGLSKEASELMGKIRLLEDSGVQDAKELTSRIEELDKQKNALAKTLPLPMLFTEIDGAIDNFNLIESELKSIASEILPDPDYNYTTEKNVILLEQIRALETRIGNGKDLLHKLSLRKKDLEHCKTHNQVQCPQCSHKWSQGYDEVKYNNICAKISKSTQQLEAIEQELKEKISLHERYKEQFQFYRSLSGLMTSTPHLTPFWDYVKSEEIIRKEPASLGASLLFKLQEHLTLEKQFHQLEQQITKLTTDLQVLEGNKSASSKTLWEQYNEINERCSQTLNQLDKLNEELSNIKHKRRVYETLTKEGQELKRLIKEDNSIIDQIRSAIYKKYLDKALLTLAEEKERRERVLNLQLSRINQVKELETVLEEYKERQVVYKVAVQELSPTEGLIAKGLLGFINHFFTQVNNFIEPIWLYPLEVRPPKPVDDGDLELDYRFPVVSKNNEDYITPDISRCSSAMAEVIDLAFMVTASKYLGLEDYPLFLDELASSFDKAHRVQAQRFMNNLVNITDFTQVFIISHYEELYGSFQNTDINVLSMDNISIGSNAVINKNFLIS